MPTVFSGTSCTFASAGAKIEDFRFLEPNPLAPLIFLFFSCPLIFFNGLHGLSFQNTYNPLFLYSSAGVIEILKIMTEPFLFAMLSPLGSDPTSLLQSKEKGV